MKTLYFDLGMGAAGDMLTAALLELFEKDEQEKILEELNSCGIPKVCFRKDPSVKCGISGTHMTVLVDGEEETEHMHDHHHDHEHPHEHDHHHDEPHSHEHEHSHEEEHHHEHDHAHEHTHGDGHTHSHTGMAGISHIINDHMTLPEEVKEDIRAVYGLIAEAESRAHGVPVTDIHFHEVGTYDAVADVAAVCLLMHRLSPDCVIASPVNTGTGQVRCAHGLMPVPAPATAFILQGIPMYNNGIRSELCTPTGAALLRHFVTKFGAMPVMKVEKTGYGMGKKDFEAANCVRAMLGVSGESGDMDEIAELVCNIDDMTAEEISFAYDRLFAAGAVDIFAVPALMKKNRPGTVLHVLCPPEKKQELVNVIFANTTTIGIRESVQPRYILKRETENRSTQYGEVRVKKVSGYGVEREKYEYDDLAAAALKAGCSIGEVKKKI